MSFESAARGHKTRSQPPVHTSLCVVVNSFLRPCGRTRSGEPARHVTKAFVLFADGLETFPIQFLSLDEIKLSHAFPSVISSILCY